MNKIKNMMVAFLAIFMLGSSFVTVSASASANSKYTKAMDKYNKTSSATYVMNMDTNHVYYQKHATSKRAVASTAKIMTLYLAIQKAQTTKNGWNQKVKISPSLARMSKNHSLGSYVLKANKKYTVRNLYKASLIASSNSATIALGQWVSGTNNKFIKKMNSQVKAWGIASQARFVSSSGLENSDLYPYYIRYGSHYDYNRVSAKALAVIASHLLKLYPAIVNDAKMYRYHQSGQTLKNANELLAGGLRYDAALHVDGLKTGYTPLAGNCLVSTSQLPNKNRVIIVSLHDRFNAYDQSRMYKMIYKTFPEFK
ncbi:D-alanyl-D-alanine carboxypeptidase [Apilactobacillus kunkeei]|uniref:D-alanyl-D-alanine carboxypeptidase family protein n=1 Tax=Apilactobacillus kunkeei TaxID=148814 RepID=UPI0006CE7A4D|nr:serine hydrolase [Apilactobacillus kunkeei]KPN80502.1 D-alanyl-D-alanine carboxypeptidase [Apilactobacillus kunkeei]